jgi:hypothetical protein
MKFSHAGCEQMSQNRNNRNNGNNGGNKSKGSKTQQAKRYAERKLFPTSLKHKEDLQGLRTMSRLPTEIKQKILHEGRRMDVQDTQERESEKKSKAASDHRARYANLYTEMHRDLVNSRAVRAMPTQDRTPAQLYNVLRRQPKRQTIGPEVYDSAANLAVRELQLANSTALPREFAPTNALGQGGVSTPVTPQTVSTPDQRSMFSLDQRLQLPNNNVVELY